VVQYYRHVPNKYKKRPLKIYRTDKRWENLRRQPHPEERRVRTMIRDGQDKGNTTQQIADRLNRAGITTIKGKHWTPKNLLYFMGKWGLTDNEENRAFRKRVLRQRALEEVLRVLRPKADEPFTAATLIPHLLEDEQHRYAFDIKSEIGAETVAKVETILLRFVEQKRLRVVRHGVYVVVYQQRKWREKQ